MPSRKADPLRREFLGHERLGTTLYGAVQPDPAALECAGRIACLAAFADAIRTKLNPNPADLTGVMGDIGKLLDASITGVEMPTKPTPVLDLSKIDFEALRKRFKEPKHRNTDLEVLKAANRAQLEKLIHLNKTRAQLRLTIEDVLDTSLPRVYSPDLDQGKCSAIFEHVFESDPERDVTVYASAI